MWYQNFDTDRREGGTRPWCILIKRARAPQGVRMTGQLIAYPNKGAQPGTSPPPCPWPRASQPGWFPFTASCSVSSLTPQTDCPRGNSFSHAWGTAYACRLPSAIDPSQLTRQTCFRPRQNRACALTNNTMRLHRRRVSFSHPRPGVETPLKAVALLLDGSADGEASARG